VHLGLVSVGIGESLDACPHLFCGRLRGKEGMPEPMNLLRYFIVDEIGTSQLLATILDPYPEPAILRAQSIVWEKFSEYLRDRGVEIRETSPRFVQRGIYLDDREIDLLLGWHHWLVGIENKVRADSIRKETKKQLQDQHDKLRALVASNTWGPRGFGPQSGTCLVFLVPRQGDGDEEYKQLRVREEDGDAKVYLTWESVLGWLSEITWPQDSAIQAAFATMVAHGLELTRELLRTRKVRRLSSPPEFGTFLAAVAERVDSTIEGIHPWQASSQKLVKTLYYSYWDKRVEYICDVSETRVYIKLHLGTEKPNMRYRRKAKEALHKRFGTIESRLGTVEESFRSPYPRTVWETIPMPGGLADLSKDEFVERVANRLIEYITIIHPMMQQINEEMELASERDSEDERNRSTCPPRSDGLQ